MESIPDHRPLSDAERSLVDWLLEHGASRSPDFLEQLGRVEVIARCGCGCASVDFAIDGNRAPGGAGMEVLSDYQWLGPHGELFGVFVFARQGILAGLELWSIDGAATPSRLPQVSELKPLCR